MTTFLNTAKKAVGALFGGVTGAVVVTALGLFGVTVDPELAGAIAVIAATVGTWLAPKNNQSTELLDDVE